MNWDDFQIWCGALCAWREARCEGRDGIRAVLHVIKNRAEDEKDRWPKSWAEVIYQRLQFSSMTYPHDAQLTKIPTQPDPQFVDCYEIAQTIFDGGDFDLTNGAHSYYADYIEQPAWAKTMKQTAKIGHHIFFK